MRLFLYIQRLVLETVKYGLVTKRPYLVVAVILGLVLVAVSVAAQATAPLVVYPFA